MKDTLNPEAQRLLGDIEDLLARKDGQIENLSTDNAALRAELREKQDFYEAYLREKQRADRWYATVKELLSDTPPEGKARADWNFERLHDICTAVTAWEAFDNVSRSVAPAHKVSEAYTNLSISMHKLRKHAKGEK